MGGLYGGQTVSCSGTPPAMHPQRSLGQQVLASDAVIKMKAINQHFTTYLSFWLATHFWRSASLRRLSSAWLMDSSRPTSGIWVGSIVSSVAVISRRRLMACLV
jgi:hypothetical protein